MVSQWEEVCNSSKFYPILYSFFFNLISHHCKVLVPLFLIWQHFQSAVTNSNKILPFVEERGQHTGDGLRQVHGLGKCQLSRLPCSTKKRTKGLQWKHKGELHTHTTEVLLSACVWHWGMFLKSISRNWLLERNREIDLYSYIFCIPRHYL